MLNIRAFKLAGGRRKGYGVFLGETERTCAYRASPEQLDLDETSLIEDEALLGLSRKGERLTLCFASHSIYADIGEFSCVSPEATSAHIRSTVDKLRLFRDEYVITYTKIQDIDNIRAKYSYLVIPEIELEGCAKVDADNAVVDIFTPVEAALASALLTKTPNMAIIVYADSRYIRIIAAKDGIIYHLAAINAHDSFDLTMDTTSAIRETIALIMNTYREKAGQIYLLGEGVLEREKLEETGLVIEPLQIDGCNPEDPTSVILYGAIRQTRYDFTPEHFKKLRVIINYARISLGVSLLMVFIAGIFLIIGLMNVTKIATLRHSIDTWNLRNTRTIAQLQKDYTLISKDIDLANINTIVQTFQRFQSEPKLPAMVNSITRTIPDGVFLTKISITRPDAKENAPAERIQQMPGAETAPVEQISSFHGQIEGIINHPYPQSKDVFTTLLANLQRVYEIENATFTHKQNLAEFTVKCRIKL